MELPQGTQDCPFCKNKRVKLMAAVIAALALVVVLVLLLGGNRSGPPAPAYTAAPTAAPTAVPTAAPTTQPTAEPTTQPTAEPTARPTAAPQRGYITSGSYTISTVTDDLALCAGRRKGNGMDTYGLHITFGDRNAANCIVFRLIAVEGNACRLSSPNTNVFGQGEYPAGVLDVFNISQIEGCEVDLWCQSRDQDQLWLVERQTDGSYIIYLDADSGSVLTYDAGGEIGEQLLLCPLTGADTQRWKLEPWGMA